MSDILSRIDISNLSATDSFSLAQRCSRLLQNGTEADADVARSIVIHVLDKWASIPPETYPIWADITDAIGFYPYIMKNQDTMITSSFPDEIRQKHYLSDYLNSTYMHKEQKRLSEYILAGKNVIASAPTSFGKSLLIEEIVASKRYNNIVIIQPTLALLDETRIKLKKYNTHYKIIVRTSQLPSDDKGNLFLLTAERVMEYENLPRIDFLIIDEFYKLSLRRIDERADTLNNAFLKIVEGFHSRFYLLGPNIDGITSGFAEKYDAVFYKSNYSLVDCNVIDMTAKFHCTKKGRALDNEKCLILYELLYSFKGEQTLVYCSSPSRARRFARGYCDFLIQKGQCTAKKNLPLIEWINLNISDKWSLAQELSYGISFHDGSLQKHIGASIINYFNKGLLDVIFCTSTIIEGVNTSAKNVVVFDGEKGNRPVDFFDYSNIKGRSGRLMEHYVGTVYNFISPPQREPIVIDIPFFEQNPISDEILINLSRENVRDEHKKKYDELSQNPMPLLEIIRRNGVSVGGQLKIYNTLEDHIQTSQYANISWSQIPNWDKLNYILSIAEGNIFEIDRHGINSVRQLSFFLDEYRKSKNIMSIVQLIYNNKIESVSPKTVEKNSIKYYDEAIESAFHIYRRWFQFTVPKVFRVVDSLQRYVCEQHGKKAGSYSYFVQQLENDFIPENLSILSEYGLPISAIRKIIGKVPEELSEDATIEYIKMHKQSFKEQLLIYEQEKLEYCF